MSTWPITLPQPLADGYGISPADVVIRTDFEVGAKRARRRSFARNDRVDVKWMFTEAQFAIFRSWFDDGSTGAAGGAAWFNISLKIGTGGLVSVEARFSEVWKRGDHIPPDLWFVTATLEIR